MDKISQIFCMEKGSQRDIFEDVPTRRNVSSKNICQSHQLLQIHIPLNKFSLHNKRQVRKTLDKKWSATQGQTGVTSTSQQRKKPPQRQRPETTLMGLHHNATQSLNEVSIQLNMWMLSPMPITLLLLLLLYQNSCNSNASRMIPKRRLVPKKHHLSFINFSHSRKIRIHDPFFSIFIVTLQH